jgi:uncharacterized protein (DUF697 family)
VLGNITQFWNLTRELDVQGLRDRFEEPVTLRVLGNNFGLAQRVARLIEPDPLASEVSAGMLGEAGRTRADVVVAVVSGALSQEEARALRDLSVGEAPVVVIQIDEGANLVVLGLNEDRIVAFEPTLPDDLARERLFNALVRAAPEQMLPLGRRHPLVREAVADDLIRDTSRVNAQFAAISSVPANIPLFGGVVGDMADILVLTKNQVLLLFKLAGLYGRELELGRELLLEVLPVVGGAFFWRTAARTLVGLVPGLFGMLPKVVVAYMGTFVVGEMARYYFRYGRKPPPEFVGDLRQDALRRAREALARLRPPR